MGTEHAGQYERVYELEIKNFEIEELVLITEDGGADMLHDEEIREVALRVVNERFY